MTKEQLAKSEQLAKTAGFNQVIFRESYIEETPIVANSIDAVISNGVINLSSEKKKVFNETARILKKGGVLYFLTLLLKLNCQKILLAMQHFGLHVLVAPCKLMNTNSLSKMRV